jgi:hypothetical protein
MGKFAVLVHNTVLDYLIGAAQSEHEIVDVAPIRLETPLITKALT